MVGWLFLAWLFGLRARLSISFISWSPYVAHTSLAEMSLRVSTFSCRIVTIPFLALFSRYVPSFCSASMLSSSAFSPCLIVLFITSCFPDMDCKSCRTLFISSVKALSDSSTQICSAPS